MYQILVKPKACASMVWYGMVWQNSDIQTGCDHDPEGSALDLKHGNPGSIPGLSRS